MCYSNLKEINSLKIFHDGGKKVLGFEVPFTKTWTIEGYVDNNLIISVSKSERHNYLKYVEFIKQLKYKGYKLNKNQREHIKNYKDDYGNSFLMKSFISQAGMSDLVEIGNKAHLTDCYNNKIDVNENYIKSIKNKEENEKRCVAEQLGLEYEELLDILKHF